MRRTLEAFAVIGGVAALIAIYYWIVDRLGTWLIARATSERPWVHPRGVDGDADWRQQVADEKARAHFRKVMGKPQ